MILMMSVDRGRRKKIKYIFVIKTTIKLTIIVIIIIISYIIIEQEIKYCTVFIDI